MFQLQLLNGACGSQSSRKGTVSKEYVDLEARNVNLVKENRELTNALIASQDELGHMSEKVMMLEDSNEEMKKKLTDLQTEAEDILKQSPKRSAVEGLLSRIKDTATAPQNIQKFLAEHDASRFNASSSRKYKEENSI